MTSHFDEKQHDVQVELEKSLAQSFYQVGVSLQNNEDNFSAHLANLHDVLDKIITLGKFQFVKERFGLSGYELKLIALVFIQEIEPDSLTPYLGLTWFEQGPYLSLDKLLVLSHQPARKRAILNAGICHSLAFRWGLLQSNTQLGLTQNIRLLPELRAFLQSKEIRFTAEGLFSYPVTKSVDRAFSVFKAQLGDLESCQLYKINNQDMTFKRWYVEQLAATHSALVSYIPVKAPCDTGSASVIHGLAALLLASGGKKVFVVVPSWVERHFSSDYDFMDIVKRQKVLCFFFSNDAMSESLLNYCEITPSLPSIDVLTQVWIKLSAQAAINSEDRNKAEQVASRYPVPIYKMSAIASEAQKQSGVDFWQALKSRCLKEQRKGPQELASLMEPRFSLNDMVLSEGVAQQLHELVSRINYQTELKSRLPRFTDGCKALFWGRPGTGKSMAAEAIAGELQLPIYIVNLANIASKWIGETEKHLAKLFDEAERYNAILMFDEADAVFAKRSDVESSHDKNANMGVSYLLQRMERYSGLLLLSTNLKANLDEAFLRRFHSVIEFTLPNPSQRLAIWERVLGNNADKTLNDSVSGLAKRFELSAAQIINITEVALLQSLILNQSRISKENIAKALLRELSKQHEGFMAQHEIKVWLEGN
ncbi:ATP-binding protein [Pseudoalteromonas luteoviolacea]|uniref:ATP-binding protein n=1 Tax=Pseudoalteromonas luteoviolacea TaxID=43657 RepID=UPI001B37AD80|nr:ATP-binding protein [Pseudoalteromonas luteoviolacea]MBQ4812892.1 ATP-binding protein [Pseudoalteromonas luteoviolacea]